MEVVTKYFAGFRTGMILGDTRLPAPKPKILTRYMIVKNILNSKLMLET